MPLPSYERLGVFYLGREYDPATQQTGNEHCMVYRYRHDGPLVLHPHEIDDGQWLEPAAMDRRVSAGDSSLTSAVRLIWKRYREL